MIDETRCQDDTRRVPGPPVAEHRLNTQQRMENSFVTAQPEVLPAYPLTPVQRDPEEAKARRSSPRATPPRSYFTYQWADIETPTPPSSKPLNGGGAHCCRRSALMANWGSLAHVSSAPPKT